MEHTSSHPLPAADHTTMIQIYMDEKDLQSPSNVRSLIAKLSPGEVGSWKFISVASPKDMLMSTISPEFERLKKLSTNPFSCGKNTINLYLSKTSMNTQLQ